MLLGLKRKVISTAFGGFEPRCPGDVPFAYRTAAEGAASGGVACCQTTAYFDGQGGGVCDGNRGCCLDPPCVHEPSPANLREPSMQLQACSARCPADRPFGYSANESSSAPVRQPLAASLPVCQK